MRAALIHCFVQGTVGPRAGAHSPSDGETTGKNVAAAIFWMKARAGWRERSEVAVGPPDPLRRLSDDDLNRIIVHIVDETGAAKAAAEPAAG